MILTSSSSVLPVSFLLVCWASSPSQLLSSVNAFSMAVQQRRQPSASLKRGDTRRPTRLFLEDWVADMIDGEKYRQEHKQEFENKWMEKNKGAILHSIKKGSDSSGTIGAENNNMMVDDQEDFRMKVKDRKMAASDPERYCADRCLATGNCDVYEDFFEMSPQQVMSFCEECVLSDGEEPCDIPEAFYDVYGSLADDDEGKLRP